MNQLILQRFVCLILLFIIDCFGIIVFYVSKFLQQIEKYNADLMLKEKMSNILDEIHLANGFNRKFHNHWMVKMFFEKKRTSYQFKIIIQNLSIGQ